MAFGVYIHIPYCLQICPYCDFTKYEMGKIMPPKNYLELLRREIRSRAGPVRKSLEGRPLDTLYFGGGTPSLFAPSDILTIIDELANAGLVRTSRTEVSLEVDPATVDQTRLEGYRAIGVNRFSVGAQTFNTRLLKIAGRKHSADDTVELLRLLRDVQANYSFDLLFALPTQTLAELSADVSRALQFEPRHLSTYCLTVPETHPMAKGRAPEDEQVEMFHLIERELEAVGLMRYEVSNFARHGLESRHNLLHWTDQNYWGLGPGAHSYFNAAFDTENPFGLRFSNPPSLPLYQREVENQKSGEPGQPEWNFRRDLTPKNCERLLLHQALTDDCHTSLRLTSGLTENALRLKFGARVSEHVSALMPKLVQDGLLETTAQGWRLSSRGRILANLVFQRLTFLAEDVRHL